VSAGVCVWCPSNGLQAGRGVCALHRHVLMFGMHGSADASLRPCCPNHRVAELAPCGPALLLCCREELLTQLARLSHARRAGRGWCHNDNDDEAGVGAAGGLRAQGDGDEVLDWDDAAHAQQAPEAGEAGSEPEGLLETAMDAAAQQPTGRCVVLALLCWQHARCHCLSQASLHACRLLHSACAHAMIAAACTRPHHQAVEPQAATVPAAGPWVAAALQRR
jgi:hypothetical protein